MTTTDRPAGKPWTLAEAATHLHKSQRTLTRWNRSGLLRTIRLGRSVVIPDDEVRRLATHGTVDTTAA